MRATSASTLSFNSLLEMREAVGGQRRAVLRFNSLLEMLVVKRQLGQSSCHEDGFNSLLEMLGLVDF